MGNCFSIISEDDLETKKMSEKIDRYLEEEKKKTVEMKTCKILLLGSGESGKSTIFKQMKIIHMNGYTQAELIEYKHAIYRNIMESIKNLTEAIRTLNIEYDNQASKDCVKMLEGKKGGIDIETPVTQELAHLIGTIWKDPACKIAMRRSNEFYMMDSASYFLDHLERISSVHYVPTEDDVLRARIKSTGITETRFTMDRLNICMYDVGGQRSERRKWIHCFEGVTSVIFVVALSEYDQVLLEDSSQNRMAESLQLFESIVNSQWFLNSSIILFLNKIDLFKEKLQRQPLSKFFPEYAGDDDFNKASKFILWRFKQTNRQNLVIYPHLTCATDTRQIRVVFSAVKDTLIKNSLKDVGIM